MSLRRAVLTELDRAFPDQFATGPEEGLIARFTAAHPLVGDVTIWDDQTEVTLAVGEITHFHLDESYANEHGDAASFASSDLHAQLAREVVAWLDALFRDQILMYRSSAGGGGHQRFPKDAEWSLMNPEDETFRWSGPVSNPLA